MFWRRKKQEDRRAGSRDAAEPVAALISDVGCHRELNEDSGRVVHSGPGRGLLAVVADGMGGHQAGKVASHAAVEIIAKEYGEARGTPGAALEQAFLKAHHRILKLAKQNASMSGMGTTCTALAIVDGRAWAAHVGDSRVMVQQPEGGQGPGTAGHATDLAADGVTRRGSRRLGHGEDQESAGSDRRVHERVTGSQAHKGQQGHCTRAPQHGSEAGVALSGQPPGPTTTPARTGPPGRTGVLQVFLHRSPLDSEQVIGRNRLGRRRPLRQVSPRRPVRTL